LKFRYNIIKEHQQWNYYTDGYRLFPEGTSFEPAHDYLYKAASLFAPNGWLDQNQANELLALTGPSFTKMKTGPYWFLIDPSPTADDFRTILSQESQVKTFRQLAIIAIQLEIHFNENREYPHKLEGLPEGFDFRIETRNNRPIIFFSKSPQRKTLSEKEIKAIPTKNVWRYP
ncbi:MAG: hypothetical protein AAF226_12440, partial [Verrucomicrobiota bacterium]